MSKRTPSTSDFRHRAGRYIPQATGYLAFLPEPLPPQPPLRFWGPCSLSILWQIVRSVAPMSPE